MARPQLFVDAAPWTARPEVFWDAELFLDVELFVDVDLRLEMSSASGGGKTCSRRARRKNT